MRQFGQEDPLMSAVVNGHLDELKEVIAQGGDLRSNEHLLHVAVRQGHEDIVTYLIHALGPRHVDHFDDSSHTPFMYAIKEYNLKMAGLLLHYGAHVDTRDELSSGNTALGEVIRETTPEIVKFLLDAGANPTIPGWVNITPYEKAQERLTNHPDSPEARLIMKMVEAAVSK